MTQETMSPEMVKALRHHDLWLDNPESRDAQQFNGYELIEKNKRFLARANLGSGFID